MTMTLIETKTLGTDASQIEFTAIPQDATDLYVLVAARSTATAGAGGAYCELRPNSSTSSITARGLRGLGSGTPASTTETILLIRINPSDYTASTFSNCSVYIPNYAGATNKSFSIDAVIENNATEGQQQILAGLWSNTAAITSMLFVPGSGNFAAGSTISLYKITKGSSGGVVVS